MTPSWNIGELAVSHTRAGVPPPIHLQLRRSYTQFITTGFVSKDFPKPGEVVEDKGHRGPGPIELIVKISHCSVRSTDEHYRHYEQGLGHEGVGIIIEVGSSVHTVSEFQNQCVNRTFFATTDWDQDCFGTVVARDMSTLFKIPDQIASEDAGPLMCGGATVWSSVYDSGVRPGDRVGVIGVGGLGHLAVQFASEMGMDVVVFSGTESKKQKPFDLGASEFHVTSGVNKPDNVAKLDILLITTNAILDMSLYLPILASGAKIFPLTISTEPLQLSPPALLMGSTRIIGSGMSPTVNIQAMLAFAAKHGIRPQVEKF